MKYSSSKYIHEIVAAITCVHGIPIRRMRTAASCQIGESLMRKRAYFWLKHIEQANGASHGGCPSWNVDWKVHRVICLETVIRKYVLQDMGVRDFPPFNKRHKAVEILYPGRGFYLENFGTWKPQYEGEVSPPHIQHSISTHEAYLCAKNHFLLFKLSLREVIHENLPYNMQEILKIQDSHTSTANVLDAALHNLTEPHDNGCNLCFEHNFNPSAIGTKNHPVWTVQL